MSNRLEKEDSPYLQQHKENPVDWWPWCDEECADILNDGFVYIKVDREECPDIDKHYQEVHLQIQLAA